MIIHGTHFRQVVLMAVDAALAIVSFFLAIFLSNLEVTNIHYRWFEYLWMISILLTVKLFVYYWMGFYKEIIRFISMGFAIKVIKGTIFGSLVAVSIIHIIHREIEMSVLVVDWMASCILVGISRFGLRYIQEGRLSNISGRRTILYGAGEHGAAVARHLIVNDILGNKVVGFIDDSREKQGKKIQGIPVVGNLDSLPRVLRELCVEELVVTFADQDGDIIKRVFRICRDHGVRCRIVPGMTDIISGNELVRNIDIADLMRRPQRTLDRGMIARFLKGRRVMVTGAAGSIGSEIFRQVLAYEPESIAAIDHSEYGLYQLDEEFTNHPLKSKCFFSLVDIKCSNIIDKAVSEFRPDIIFHAAAYKHVPILEQDIRQAILNNVKGLSNVIESAERNGVSKFVFISTDKAVRPKNVMGSTKRIGELMIRVANGRGRMKCLGVRFGNVLASSGSVVPKFISQIKAGGPVTVTHPQVTRFFMLVPEAVELVLQTGSLGEGGEIFVLDMGKPVRIAEVAEDLIYLMGHIPYTGIPIVYTGLRPGEKLYEELFHDDIERTTCFKDINIGRVQDVHVDVFESELRNLLLLAENESNPVVLKQALKSLVPEYDSRPA